MPREGRLFEPGKRRFAYRDVHWRQPDYSVPFTPSTLVDRAQKYANAGMDPTAAMVRALKDISTYWESRKYRSTAKVYGGLVANYNAEMVRALEQIQAKGGITGPSQLYEVTRYRELMGQLVAELDDVAGERLNSFVQASREAVSYTVQAADQILANALYQTDKPTLYEPFTVLPRESIMNAISRLKPASEIGKHFQATIPAGIEAMTNQIGLALAQGINPVRAAKMGWGELGISLTRMETIYRTEMLNANREASLQCYRDNEFVQRYKRISAHDATVCAACLAQDGEYYFQDEIMATHPRCRCDVIPVLEVNGEEFDPKWPAGENWLVHQPKSVQDSVLGPRGAALWRGGQVELKDFARIEQDPIWGPTLRTNSLKSMGYPWGNFPKPKPSRMTALWKNASDMAKGSVVENVATKLRASGKAFIDKGKAELKEWLVRVKGYYPHQLKAKFLAGRMKDKIVSNLAAKTGLPYNDVNDMIHQWATTSNDKDMRALAMQQRAGQLFGLRLTPWELAEIEKLRKERGLFTTEQIEDALREGRWLKLPAHAQKAWAESVDPKAWFPIGVKDLVRSGNLPLDEAIAKAQGNVDIFLKAMYETTQDEFVRQNQTGMLTLYRGVTGGAAQAVAGVSEGTTVTLAMNPLESWSTKPATARKFGYTIFQMSIPSERIIGSCTTGFGCLDETEFVILGGDLGDEAKVWENPQRSSY